MSLTVQPGVPATLIAGDAVSFKVTDADFPATAWTSKIVLKDESGAVKSFDGTASGRDHLFSLTNAQVATLTAGQNLACLQFSDGTNRQTSDWQSVNVLPDPASAQSPSFIQSQVTKWQTICAGLGKHSTVNFNGQSFTRESLSSYRGELTFWEARLIRERNQSAISRAVSVPVRGPFQFVSP